MVGRQRRRSKRNSKVPTELSSRTVGPMHADGYQSVSPEITGVRHSKPFLASASAQYLKGLEPGDAKVVVSELKSIAGLERTMETRSLRGLDGYRSTALPSGQVVIYRWLTDVEAKEMGVPSDEDGVLVADIAAAPMRRTG